MKYILEFETLEELLIAQTKVDATKATESLKYREEIIQLEKEISEAIKLGSTSTLKHHYLIKKFLAAILTKEAELRKSMMI